MSALCHSIAAKRPYDRFSVTREDNINGEMAGELSVGDSMMVRNRVPEFPRRNKRSAEDEYEIRQEEKRYCSQEFLRKKVL